MSLFDRLKYRHLNTNSQREYEILQKVGSLHHVVYFIEKLGAFEYLYFINPDDLWLCFDFAYNKLRDSMPKIDKNAFIKNLTRILKIHKDKVLTKFITDKHDPYAVAKLIALQEKEPPKSCKLLSKCGNLNPKSLNYSIALLYNVAKSYNIKNYENAYNKITRQKVCKLSIPMAEFKFYAQVFINLSNKKLHNTNETLIEELNNGNIELVTLAINELAQSALREIATAYLPNNKLDKNLYNEYVNLINLSNRRTKEFIDKFYQSMNL